MKAAASLATEKANKADAAFEMASFKIGPRQFLGLEINRRAVAIAQLVLWIGFFQWQRKTTGKADTNERPLLPKEASIVQQNAVLAYDAAVLEAYGWSDLTTRDTNKEAPHSCGAGACLAIAKREALPNEVPFAPPQECGGSITEALEQELLTRLVALTHGPDADALSAQFGKKSAKRTQQVAEILETLQGLGKL